MTQDASDAPRGAQIGAKTGAKIGVLGGGITGMGAAFALKDTHDVQLWEARERLGGHANTVTIDYEGRSIDVDTGFIVCNDVTYPNLLGLFSALDVPLFTTNMGFGFSGQGIEWSSDGSGLFARKRNALSVKHWTMLADIMRFNARARRDIATGVAIEGTLGEYLDRHGFSHAFRERYLLPMGAAIWSCSDGDMADQPAQTVLKFFHNHRLIHVRPSQRPNWMTVRGGSRTYVQAMGEVLGKRVRLDAKVVDVKRTADGVLVTDHFGRIERFDEVILACHSTQALGVLADASPDERALLGAVGYTPNQAVLHRDISMMPKARGAWAAWNYYIPEGGGAPEVTYNMNKLQGIDDDCPLFVTLNPQRDIAPDTIFGSYQYDHPQFTQDAITAQRMFNRVQGGRHTWFAGAWLGYGFHEDGLRAGLRAALRLGGQVPWDFVDLEQDGGPWASRPPGSITGSMSGAMPGSTVESDAPRSGAVTVAAE